MIHPIYGELNYKRRPKDTLKRDIPKGRGMIKWAPFATMPQQYEYIQSQIKNQNKTERLELSEDRLEEINQTLHIAINNNQAVCIEYFHDGWLESVEMMIEKIDQWAMLVIGSIRPSNQTCFIAFLDICNVTLL